MTNYDQLIGEIYSEMAKVSFNSLGMIDDQNIIHTFGTDSKIIGRLFEMFTEPILAKVAHKYSYELIAMSLKHQKLKPYIPILHL